MLSKPKFFLYTIFMLLTAAGLAACGDNPVDDGDDEHSEADGLRLVLNGVEVYRVLDGQMSCQQEPCGITVVEGAETGVVTVSFLDIDGDIIHDEDLDEDYSLGFEVGDAAVAEAEQRAQEGKWTFRVLGKQAGETRMVVKLVHLGDIAHADFQTPPLDSPNVLMIRVAQN